MFHLALSTEDKFLLCGAGVAVKSLRSGAAGWGRPLAGSRPRVRFEDWHQLSLADLWWALGVRSDIAEKLVDMQLRWGPCW